MCKKLIACIKGCLKSTTKKNRNAAFPKNNSTDADAIQEAMVLESEKTVESGREQIQESSIEKCDDETSTKPNPIEDVDGVSDPDGQTNQTSGTGGKSPIYGWLSTKSDCNSLQPIIDSFLNTYSVQYKRKN